tara:strand:- start:448 stop:654 length:207 start_codon:yes stop_codon:yes gene_type:complete
MSQNTKIPDSVLISTLVLQDRFEEAKVMAVNSGISSSSDTLEGRIQQQDYKMAYDLAVDRVVNFIERL